MKKKTVTRLFSMMLSAALAVTSVQMPVFAEGMDGGATVGGTGSVSENEPGVKGEEGDPNQDSSEEEQDYHFIMSDADLFSLNTEAMSDEEISHMVMSQAERDIKAWIRSLTDQEKESLLARNTALTQTMDVYETNENGETSCEHFDTYMDYLDTVDEKVGYKFTNATGNYYINWYSGTTSEGQSVIAVTGLKKGDSDDTQQKDLSWKVSNAKHGLALKSGGAKSWPISLAAAQKKTNYQKTWADFTYTKPVSYTASVTYDTANNGSGEYKMFQGTHNSATGCLKDNTGDGAAHYITAGTTYSGSSNYSAATTETFNIGPNFTNMGCTDSASNTNTVARITLNPVYMSITWNQNGGSGSNCQPSSVLYGNAHDQATAPTRAGYSFAGWSGYNATAGVTSNVTYTAAWNANRYTITYDGAGGSLSKASDTVVYGGNIPAMPTASRAGYSLTGWTWSGYSGSGAYTYVGNSTAKAGWSANQYTIHYDANGGQVSPSSNGVTYDSPCPTAPTPTRTGYTFTGWSGGTYSGTYRTAGDTTVKAGWKANQYIIRYDANGGAVTPATNSVTYDQQCPAAPTPTRMGYTFTGWSGGTCEGTYKTAGDTTVKAGWKANNYVVTFDPDGGSQVEDIEASYDTPFTLPQAPKKADYAFIGWSDGIHTYAAGENVTNLTSDPDGRVALKAEWIHSSFVVSFNSNGGSEITDIKYSFGENTTFPVPTRADEQQEDIVRKYTFAGWVDENGKVYTTAQDVTDETDLKEGILKLTAQWNVTETKTSSQTVEIRHEKETEKVVTVPGGETIIEKPVYETNNYTNNYNMTDEQARIFLEKLKNGIVSEISIKGIRYEVIKNTDGTISIRIADIGTTKEVTIPDSIQIGDAVIPVTMIDKGTFRNHTTLEKVTLGKYITTIKDSAFEGCTSLSTVKLNNGLVNIGKKAFSGCTALKKISIPKSVLKIDSKAFYNCKKLASVTGGKGLMMIGSKAFMNCKSLKKFTLYNAVVQVGKQAFYGCNKLKKVTIKSKVLSKVGAKAFKKTHKQIKFVISDKSKKDAYQKLLKGKY